MRVDGRDTRAIYASAAVERMVGVDADTIRRWEERYGLPTPVRSPGGQLLYSRDDVERLRWIAQELAAGREPTAVPDGWVRGSGPGPGDEGRRRLLVLLAERDPRAADLEEFFLRTEGYAVEVTFSAEETSVRCAEARPDVIVVELTLSQHAGIALCRQLRELSDSPVVAVSSLDLRDEALAAGAEAFVLKPLDPLTLVSTIKDLLGESAFLRDDEVRTS